MNKNFKTYGICFLASLLGLIALFIGTNYIIDPMFRYHAPYKGVAMNFNDGRYQNPGIASNFDYDTLVMGTSVSANFKASQFDELFDAKTAKIIYLDGHFSEFSEILDIAKETHDIKRVFWGIDSNILLRDDKTALADLPSYMYEDGFFEALQYLLNKDVFLTNTAPAIGKTFSGKSDTMDSAYSWGKERGWSAKKALASYPRPEKSIELKNDVFLRDMNKNIDIVSKIIEASPNIEFNVFLAPYSVLYWDKQVRTGVVEATLNAQSQAMVRLAQYSNVNIYYFMNDEEIISNLDNYTDTVHYSPEINERMVEIMSKHRKGISATDVPFAINSMREFINNYDFNKLFNEEIKQP